jgi:hypothetical protein
MMDQVRNLGLGGKTCLDSPARKADLHKPAGLYPCHNQGGNQVRTFVYRWQQLQQQSILQVNVLVFPPLTSECGSSSTDVSVTNMNLTSKSSTECVVTSVTLLTSILEILGLNLNQDTGYCHALEADPQLSHGHFLPDPFQFYIQQSS